MLAKADGVFFVQLIRVYTTQIILLSIFICVETSVYLRSVLPGVQSYLRVTSSQIRPCRSARERAMNSDTSVGHQPETKTSPVSSCLQLTLISRRMHLESLLITYGYPILFVGILLEGEAFLILAAYLAHRGYFSLPVVIGLATLASFTMAQIWFVLGNRFGPALLNRRPAWQARLVRVDTLLQRYGSSLVLGFRALFGLRTLIPVAIGISTYPTRQFALLNGLGALIWALVVALAGNTIAQGLDVLLTDLRQHELAAVVIIALIGLVWGLIRFLRQPKVL